ncbi:MAG TPA: hypothetical protein VLT85_08710 [Terriglobales bacterium]|nr:hypothetical protein [Terriglobales bacterium]
MSKSSRRAFLAATGTFLAAAAALPLRAVAQAPAADAGGPAGRPSDPAHAWLGERPQDQSMSLYQFTPQLFQPLVGSSFQVADSQGHRLALRLVEVNDLRKQNPGAQTAFSLRFQQQGGKALEQGTYQFSAPPLGTFLLFVVPAKARTGATYTAIINRL